MAGRAQAAGCQAESAGCPSADGFAEFVRAPGGRVIGKLVEIVRNDLLNEVWRRMFGFTNTERNRPEMVGRGDAGLESGQFFERVGVESVQIRIH